MASNNHNELVPRLLKQNVDETYSEADALISYVLKKQKNAFAKSDRFRAAQKAKLTKGEGDGR